MTELTLLQLQNYLGDKYEGKVNTTSLFMKLVEEVGEIAEAMNQIDGRKKKQQRIH